MHHLPHAPGGLLALLAAGVEPLGVFRPAWCHGGNDRWDDVIRKGPEMLTAIVVPGRQLRLIGTAAGDGQAALHHLEVEIDADILPVLLDRLHELLKRGVGRAGNRYDQAQPTLTIAA